MKNNLGMGVMIDMLRGNKETVESVQSSIGKKIESIVIDDNNLKITFDDGSLLKLWDGGQSCCEHRYMSTDDDLGYFKGAELLKIEIKDAPNVVMNDYEEHEVQFLEVTTSTGSFQCANHNEHNGYYGGFSINAELGDTVR